MRSPEHARGTGFVKDGIVVNGIEEEALRDHDSYEKLQQEVFDIARAKSALGTASTSSPLETGALRRVKGNGKGKEKGKDETEGRDSGMEEEKEEEEKEEEEEEEEKEEEGVPGH